MNKKELEKLILETVQDTLEKANTEQDQKLITMSGGYKWKENIMKSVQDALYARADMLDTQDQYEGAVDEEIQKVREDVDLTLSMVGRALYQVPFQAFKIPENIKNGDN